MHCECRHLWQRRRSTYGGRERHVQASTCFYGATDGSSRHQRCSPSRRSVLLAAPLVPAWLWSTQQSYALNIEEVTPAVVPQAPLSAREAAIVDAYARTTRSVVNIFDVALLGRAVVGGGATETAEGNGTGVVWDNAGHIVTNWHVLQGSLAKMDRKALEQGPKVAQVLVLQPNGLNEVFPATLVGADKARDLAVLHIDAAGLQPALLGASASVRVGQQTLAIGNPFGFDHTLTAGIVSSLGRGVRSEVTGETLNDCIQTDAAINPGNSGGPLLNVSGEVIGINTQIFSATGASAGLGFAIPIDTVKNIVPQLIKYGRVKRAALNVQFANDDVSSKLGVREGAMIQNVVAGGAAEKAGLLPLRRTFGGILPGDVVVGLNGRPVVSRADVSKALDALQIGDTVSVAVRRYGTGQEFLKTTVDVILGEEES